MTMLAPRRFLPSTAYLAAFEAAARLGSFTAAAQELSITQSAVSRQIKSLESQLGVELFVREKQTVHLTGTGESYAKEIREALRTIASASINLKANPFGGTLNLAVLPTFGTRWLAPLLPDFYAKHPGITINLATRLRPIDFRAERQDAAIYVGTPEWMGAEHEFLMPEVVVPACSPKLLAGREGFEPKELLDVALLHLETRPDAWERWFASQNVSGIGAAGMILDQFTTATQAAIAGLGVALLPEFLIERELASGELVVAAGPREVSDGGYYLVWPSDRNSHLPLIAFRE
ncbi:MAG: LysR substrate-binding domain-containing protein, partial [Pseudomonadota bacterium]